LLRGLKDNFEAAGYEVRTANDGQKGLNTLIASPPNLLLLDLMLPRVNGYQICREARERKLDLPIIMLTAKGQEEDVVRGLEVGADDYVTKPFSPRELVLRIQACLKDRVEDAGRGEVGRFHLTRTNLTSGRGDALI
jgi:DNA-binding response OmpR family regulator